MTSGATLSLASRQLLELALPEGARVSSTREAVTLSLHSATLQVTLTVPSSLLEWSVAATDRRSGANVEDWCNYSANDVKAADQLDRDMAADVARFVASLLHSELRIAKRGAGDVVLEWKTDGQWRQAVPLK